MSDSINPDETVLVMTPVSHGPGHTTIRFERISYGDLDASSVKHVAGGTHSGIIINRQTDSAKSVEDLNPDIWLEFKVFLRSSGDDDMCSQESRLLNFWFYADVLDNERMHTSQDFFKELVSPCEFPRDYVGFIKKIMKLMQLKYPNLQKVACELKQLESVSSSKPRPVSVDEKSLNARMLLSAQSVLEHVEGSYPNPVNLQDIARAFNTTKEEAYVCATELVSKNLIRELDNGDFVRVTHDDTEVRLIKHMPPVVREDQPTIAIITAQYCEKVAVDAMIENKNTFVKYKTEGGESNVYTLGNIGNHRVVSTKLPAVGGQTRESMIAAGNTTTRLLGTFQKVDYVLLVGCGGGVPHYTDYSKHVRMGDIVVSCRPTEVQDNDYIYMYAERSDATGEYSVKKWCPSEMKLQEIANELWQRGKHNPDGRTWESYLEKAIEMLKQIEQDYNRPDEDTDRLFMSIGEKEVIEVSHPVAPEGRLQGPQVHFGAVGAGRMDEAFRHQFAYDHGIRCFDAEFDAVVESIYGNRKEHYMFIRGISDYKDGAKRKEWQPYAALVAAAFMKAVVLSLD